MAETLGSLCDKLTIVKLKQFHTDDKAKLKSLSSQENQLKDEIDNFLSDAIERKIPSDRLRFSTNKVYKKEGNITREIKGRIGELFAELANINCVLWHQQEMVYDFENVLPENKDAVVKKLAILNLERNVCIDAIDSQFQAFIEGEK